MISLLVHSIWLLQSSKGNMNYGYIRYAKKDTLGESSAMERIEEECVFRHDRHVFEREDGQNIILRFVCEP